MKALSRMFKALSDETRLTILGLVFPFDAGPEVTAVLDSLGSLLANHPLPQAAPLLVQIREARERGDAACTVSRGAP